MNEGRLGKFLSLLILLFLIFQGTSVEAVRSLSGDERNRFPQATPTEERSLREFHLLTEREGWLWIGHRLYRTDDGGNSWQEITPPQPDGLFPQAVFFLDSRRGWAVFLGRGEEGKVTYLWYTTGDGGDVWEKWQLASAEFDSTTPPGAIYLHFVDPLVGWMVVKQATSSNFSVGALFRTDDGGHTWEKLAIPIGEPVYFVTPERGWVAGGPTGSELYRTFDGGTTWSPQGIGDASLVTGSGQRFYYQPTFEDEMNGVLPVLMMEGAESRMEFYTTDDNGDTWRLDRTIPLGETDGDARVPVAVMDTDHQLVASPDGRGVLSITRDAIEKMEIEGGITEIDMASASVGWARQDEGNCTSRTNDGDGSQREVIQCVSKISLLHTYDGGRTWSVLPLPPAGSSQIVVTTAFPLTVSESETSLTGMEVVDRTIVFQGQGFDKCEIPTSGQMQAWWNGSPYRIVNLYIGGSCRTCSNAALSAAYLSQLNQQGWRFISTWVGPQSLCYPRQCPSRISDDPSTAYNQGVAEADAALATAIDLGLANSDGSGTVLYYDLEAYDVSSNSPCTPEQRAAAREPAKAFISGWTARLRERGSKAGVYGSSCASHLGDFAGINPAPDALWPAYWIYDSYKQNASVWDVLCVPDSHWANHQRIRQYAGGHDETWGGVTLNIDSDVLDGIVAVPASGDSSTVVVVEEPTLTPAYDGMCTSAWYRYLNNRGHFAYLTLNTNNPAYSTNAAVWRPNLPQDGTYKVEAYIPNHAAANWQCPSKVIAWDTSDARYVIYHAHGRSAVSGDQAPLANQWLDLGTYTFNAGTDGRVELTDLNGEPHIEKTISFSAMRFTLVGDPQAGEDEIVVEDPGIHPSYGGGMCDTGWYRFSNNRGHYAYLTLNTNDPNQSTNWAEWRPTLPQAGRYTVEAYIANHTAVDWQCPSKRIIWDTSDARYTINQANGQTTVSKDQAPLADQWLTLGTWNFNAGTDGWVKLTDLNGETNLEKTVSFSAMRFTRHEDVTKPWGRITYPNDNPTISGPILLTAEAEDNPAGSGVKRVRFWTHYATGPHDTANWVNVADDNESPYETYWLPPGGLRSQLIEVGIHVEDNDGNYCIDPSPTHDYDNCLEPSAKQTFIYKQPGVEEYWLPANLRAYLNQRSLVGGDIKCGAASVAMMLAMYGKIGSDYNSMAAVADSLPGDKKASFYTDKLNSQYGLGVVEKTYGMFDKDDFWQDVVASIKTHHPVILMTRQFTQYGHYVVVVGYRIDGDVREFIVYDPYGRWKGTRGSYDLNTERQESNDDDDNPDTSRESAKGRWVWYSLDDIWPDVPFWEFSKRKPYLIIDRSVASLAFEQVRAPQTPDSPPDMVSTEEEDIGIYEGVVPIWDETTVYLPLIVRNR